MVALVSFVFLGCGSRTDPLDENVSPEPVVDCSACPTDVFVGDVELRGQSDVDAMAAYGEIDGKLSVAAGATLTSFEGLECIASVAKGLHVVDNHSFQTTNGLSCLSSVGSTFQLRNVTALENTDGLQKLSSVGGHMVLRDLPTLTDIAGLSGLRTVKGNIFFFNVPELPTCDAAALIDQLANLGGEPTIEGTSPDTCGP